MGTFYEELYKTGNIEQEEIDKYLKTVSFENILMQDQKESLEKNARIRRIYKCLKTH